ncbi:hypothetical protein EUX98_g8493 [Antrodiella citrinella]|uniref:Uncharacterized protein n=1 Tax=Antrodiella citrinella TaxID=2447956 RepID=A0A4S4M8K1_9APHY|nr:hypothetical protein EUX98_g8493 [Antrodiella citrinella]
MTTEFSSSYLASTTLPSSVGVYPSFPSIAGLGFYPSAHYDLYPSLRSRFEGLVEEARLDALKEWAKKNQAREEARLETEGELEGYIVKQAEHQAEFWDKALVLLELQRQKAEAELVKARDRTLDERLARKALADAERAEHERDITADSLTRKAQSEALRAAAEVELVKCQYQKVEVEKKKLDWEISLVGAMVETSKSEKVKFDAERLKADAERATADADKLRVEAEAAKVRAEKIRVDAETAKVTAEKATADAETQRAFAEANLAKVKAQTTY